MQKTDLQFLELIKLDEIVCRRNFYGIYFYDSKLVFCRGNSFQILPKFLKITKINYSFPKNLLINITSFQVTLKKRIKQI